MHPETKMCVIIPSYAEESIDSCLNSLIKAGKPNYRIEVIVVINQSENDAEEILTINNRTKNTVLAYSNRAPSWMRIHCVGPLLLEQKKAGVGVARKIGMDEAAFRFQEINFNGLMVCFDADSTVASNYFQILERTYLKEGFFGASIHYEHDIEGVESLPIILYELQLRYYVLALDYSGYPYAFHTIGSSMAVSTDQYLKLGGMNTRKAGEDFYFLHKLIPLGNFISINDTCVYPSARISERVPFGTGRAMLNYKKDSNSLSQSYNFKSFQKLKELLLLVNNDEPAQGSSYFHHFLQHARLMNEYENIQKQSKNQAHFKERFFLWFNGFKVLKFIHFLRDHYFPNVSLKECVKDLLESDKRIKSDVVAKEDQNEYKYFLTVLRDYEKTQ